VFVGIIEAIDAHRPLAVILDPISALAKQANDTDAAGVAFRIVQECKMRGITLCLTSLVGHADPSAETTELQIATITDTWIHLSYLVRSGERNRAITVVKSRGSGHSNQVRELILSSRGISLENVYSEEGEVLMGTMRAQREARTAEKRILDAELRLRERAQKESQIEQLAARIGEQQLELRSRKQELATDVSSGWKTSLRNRRDRDKTSVMRRADASGAKGAQS
jgi:circadian clock protein KaiC